MSIQRARETIAPFGALIFVQSDSATLPPSAKPLTDDMRAMVDHFHALDLIKRRPAMVQVGNTMIVHPTLFAQVRDHFQNITDSYCGRPTASHLIEKGLL